MAVAHFTLDFSARNESGDAVDDEDIDRIRANESVDDLERLFASVRLGNDEIVDVDAELASIDRIEGMFGIDESSGTAGGLGCSDSVQGQSRLARAFWAVDFNDRSEEHTSELQSLMRISYAVFCLKK